MEQAWDEETADVAREKGPPPGAMAAPAHHALPPKRPEKNHLIFFYCF
jgi:hypothetical protein